MNLTNTNTNHNINQMFNFKFISENIDMLLFHSKLIKLVKYIINSLKKNKIIKKFHF